MTLERVLMPEEVRALQKPHVQERVRQFNAEQLRGIRLHWVLTPLFEDVATLIRAAGWRIANVQPVVHGSFISFETLEPPNADFELAELGARIVKSGPCST